MCTVAETTYSDLRDGLALQALTTFLNLAFPPFLPFVKRPTHLANAETFPFFARLAIVFSLSGYCVVRKA